MPDYGTGTVTRPSNGEVFTVTLREHTCCGRVDALAEEPHRTLFLGDEEHPKG